MNRNVDLLIKLLVWVIAIFILLGYFNPSKFFCSHSINWGPSFSFCSIASMAEGMVAFVFIVISIDVSLKRTALYLSIITMLLIIINCLRTGNLSLDVAYITAYSWNIFGIFIGIGLSKNRLKMKKYLLGIGFLFLLLGIWQEEIDLAAVKLYLWLISFTLIAFLIKWLRSSLLLKL